ncbi:MAG: pyridoxamine 5'-phosphate oxidase family protein [Thermodesulfobacteriota bacterium]|nr:pyridoxamine 5'-phosphate oxidase family protein [Thermodesulfobacteriota bacterium]
MRRQELLISDTEAIAILKTGEYGILSTVYANNEPYGVPLSYCLINECIFFHCAPDGAKINNLSFY